MVLFSSLNRSLILLTITLSSLLAQDFGGRNITVPTTTTTTTAATSASTPTANTPATAVNGTAAGNTTTTTANTTITNSTTTKQPTTTVNLTTIADRPGSNSVPVPGSSGGKPNGRYGPDDQYIAAVGKLMIPQIKQVAIILGAVGALVTYVV